MFNQKHRSPPLTVEDKVWHMARMKARIAEQQIRTQTVREFFDALGPDQRDGMLLEFLYELYDKGHGPFWNPADDL